MMRILVMMPMPRVIWMVLLLMMTRTIQIKTTATLKIVMDNLPFLSQSQSQSRSEVQQQPDESEWQAEQPTLQRYISPPSKPDLLDSIKSNPMALILIGIIVGAMLMNMRPVIIKSGAM